MRRRFFLDTEFNGFGGELISLALVRDDGISRYFVRPKIEIDNLDADPWVKDNILPAIYSVPSNIDPIHLPRAEWGWEISYFLYMDDDEPQVFCDWHTDIVEMLNLLETAPHETVWMGNQTHLTVLRHIDVYPTRLPGAVRHNAWWDAMALRDYVAMTEGR